MESCGNESESSLPSLAVTTANEARHVWLKQLLQAGLGLLQEHMLVFCKYQEKVVAL